ncbi:hypothetical protein SBF1_1200005 [Candidatus Desulfosporosinus infrequens]|uniref:Uncharacterized protein n=1 Tax=Candidatus Desulfosporosinus infrequens TaxID=2043169 RepID=A0A2U3K0G3_9FIRM|nr:hypothetical protein SBF1_1200005 [Candidatus Desulfosporosinus infrequens]
MSTVSARSSVDRVTVSEAGGRRFKSRRAHHNEIQAATNVVALFISNLLFVNCSLTDEFLVTSP